MKKSVFVLISLGYVVSACQKPLLNQNKIIYEKRCFDEGLEKGSVFFSQCVQRHFYVDEDKLNEEKYAAYN